MAAALRVALHATADVLRQLLAAHVEILPVLAPALDAAGYTNAALLKVQEYAGHLSPAVHAEM